MTDCKEKEGAIKIEFSGDREDLINTIKALVHLMGNQTETNSMHNLMCSNLIDDMLTSLL